MRNKIYRGPIGYVLAASLLAIPLTPLFAQTATKTAPAHTAASPVDSVIQLVKSGMSEGLIIKTLQKQNKAVSLSPADLVKLQKAGVSENIISTMMDPSATPAAAAPVAPTPAPGPAIVSTPAPAAPSAPATATSPSMVPPAPTAVSQADKKRVIVDDFDYSTVKTTVQAVFGTEQNVGKGIKAMLVTRLANQGHVVVVERGKNIDVLMKEQDRNQSNRVKQGSGSRVGRISGADALLTGDITTFGRDDKHKGVGAGGFGGGWLGGAAAALSASKTEDKAVVVINYRLVDAETSEVIATGEARGESARKSKALAAFAAGYNRGAVGGGGGGFDMTSSNFAETIIGEATQDCVNKLADILNTQAAAMKKVVRDVEASVADVSGSSLTITAGANDGVSQGDIFEVLKVTREVRDPTTKEVLDRLTDKVGEMTIVSVRDKIATGNYQGSTPQVGFLVRKKI